MENIIKVIDDLKDDLKTKPNLIPLDDIVALHRKLETLGGLEKALKKHIINQLRSGFKANGFKLVKTKGIAGYTDKDEVLKRILRHVEVQNISLIPLVNPISITQIRKSLGAEVVADLLGDLIITNPEGKEYDYAPLDDERPETR